MMFRAAQQAKDLAPGPQSIPSALRTVCDDYQSHLVCKNDHHEAAETVKAELQSMSRLYSSESEDFKLACQQFLVAGLFDYLIPRGSKKFIRLLTAFRAQYPDQFNDAALQAIRQKYPESYGWYTFHLANTSKGQTGATIWSAQGGVEAFHEAYVKAHPKPR